MAGAGGAAGTPTTGAFDFVQYMSQYSSGGLKIARLNYIADMLRGKPVGEEAARMVMQELRKTSRTAQYKEFGRKFSDRGVSGISMDDEWIARTEEESQRRLMQLEQELGLAKTNVDKEKTRLAYTALGLYYSDRGDTQGALKHFTRARDYCANSKHILEMCLHVIRVSIEGRSWAMVNQHVTKAEQSGQAATDKVALGQVRVAAALFLLDGRKYKAAARRLLDVPPEQGMRAVDAAAELLPAGDVATIAGLCALASFDRAELKKRALDNTPFRSYFEQAPEIFQVIRDFHDSRYACLKNLDMMRERLGLDYFLRNHVTALYDQIRNRALKQYAAPYLTVDLSRMAQAFNTSVPLLEKELAHLIQEGHITSRIDSANKVLHARRDNVRQATFEKAIAAGNRFLEGTEGQIRRLNMSRSDFQFRQTRPSSADGGESGGPQGFGAGLMSGVTGFLSGGGV
eukprot:TRINITY_DN21640_c0_g1_i1.p1 TRINITY_DN21640_c0_g1~~TRINITY_DN21640_c0_g1_i1.p1  ORF type:complete len:529 (+),score=183.29 TRINITY_DN21640_c0_g1_i1:215-1588(+)